MSKTYKKIAHAVVDDLVVGITCDVCKREIPPTPRKGPRKPASPYFEITTHHHDWGNDSIESFEYYHACSPECALKFAKEYLSYCFDGHHSRTIEIEHYGGWFLPEEVDANA